MQGYATLWGHRPPTTQEMLVMGIKFLGWFGDEGLSAFIAYFSI